MTKTILDPVLYLVQQLSELELTLRAVDRTDNQGEPCEHCSVPLHRNSATLHGLDHNNQRATADCCVRCIPTVAREYFDQLNTITVEVSA